MATNGPSTPTGHEPFVDTTTGKMTRTWNRIVIALMKGAGTLSTSIVVKPNSFFQSGDLNSGSTLEPASIPTGSLLGNSSGSLTDASPQAVGPSLLLNNGTLEVAPLEASSLLGNPTGSEAIPSAILIGNGLRVQGTNSSPVLNVVAGEDGTDLAAAQTLSWWRSS